MVHNLNQTFYASMDYLFAKSKKTYFWGVFGHYPQNEMFSQNSSSVSYLPLRHPIFMRNFRKILWGVLEKTLLCTDNLTYWQWWNHRTPFKESNKFDFLDIKGKVSPKYRVEKKNTKCVMFNNFTFNCLKMFSSHLCRLIMATIVMFGFKNTKTKNVLCLWWNWENKKTWILQHLRQVKMYFFCFYFLVCFLWSI